MLLRPAGAIGTRSVQIRAPMARAPWPSDPSTARSKRNAACTFSSGDNNVDQALKALKKKMQREGVFREAVSPLSRRGGQPYDGRSVLVSFSQTGNTNSV